MCCACLDREFLFGRAGCRTDAGAVLGKLTEFEARLVRGGFHSLPLAKQCEAFASAYFQPREVGDRPNVVPKGSVNFAFIGNFAETPRDTVFTTEYSIRTGMEAVYTLCNVDRGVPEVWGSVYDIRDLLYATSKLLDGKKPAEFLLPTIMPILGLLKEPLTNNVVADLLKKYNIV